MSHNIYPYPWPPGTCHFVDLPLGIQQELLSHVVDGDLVMDDLVVHRTATEGPYISFAGWKVRVTILEVTETTYTVRLA